MTCSLLHSEDARAGETRCQPQWSGRFFDGVSGRIERLYEWKHGAGGPLLIAAGAFNAIEGVEGWNIMAFDGQTWQPFGQGLGGANDKVYDIAEFDSDGDGVTELYAVGSFTNSGSMSLTSIARWDGSDWSPVGSAITTGFSAIRSIAVFDDGQGPRLFVSGLNLIVESGASMSSVAMFDGTGWVSVGGGVAGTINKLLSGSDPATDEPVLYMMGNAPPAGGPGFHVQGIGGWNGREFFNVGGGASGGEVRTALMYEGSLIVNGTFTMLGAAPITRIGVWNGLEWAELPDQGETLFGPFLVYDLGDGSGECLYAVRVTGSYQGSSLVTLTRWNGRSWQTLDDTTKVGGYGAAICGTHVSGQPRLFMGSNALYSYDARSGLRIHSAGIHGMLSQTSVRALRVHDDGSGEKLLAGGSFTEAGSVRANSIAAWDGEKWSALGAGVQGTVIWIESFDDGLGEQIYVGRTASNQSPVMRWDGENWHAVDGLPNHVSDATVWASPDGPRLVVSGSTGSPPSHHVFQWDGTSWSTLGEPFSKSVLCVHVFDDGTGPALYAGGTFISNNGTILNAVAKWDGRAWQPLGSGVAHQAMTYGVSRMTTYKPWFSSKDMLIVAGYFQQAGEATARHIAAWDGNDWHALGGGVINSVHDLRSVQMPWDAVPMLYVSGKFTAVDGSLQASNIARWNGLYWQNLPSAGSAPDGLNWIGHSLEVFVQDGVEQLFVGGEFHTAGGKSASRIASWRGCPTFPPSYPPCRYEVVVPLTSNHGALAANALTNQGLALLSNLHSGNPDAMYLWSGEDGLSPILLPTGWTSPFPNAINENGSLAAGLRQQSYQTVAHVRVAGEWNIIPGVTQQGYSTVRAMNNRDVAIGMRGFTAYTSENDIPFVWDGGVLSNIEYDGATAMSASDINDSGAVVGTYRDVRSTVQPYIWSKGRLTTLPMPDDSVWPHVAAINNLGQIAGSVRVGSNGGVGGHLTPVVWENGEWSLLDRFPGYLHSFATDINIHGDVVGRAVNPTNSTDSEHLAILWRDGEIINLNEAIPASLFVELTTALAINDHGEILCDGGLLMVILKPIAAEPADVNSDCRVDLTDLLIVIDEWGKDDSPADVNDDGIVDVSDLLLVIAAWR